MEFNNEPICFVVMGYGRKFDYRHKRYINLDETYKRIIEPAVKRAGFKCIRCDSDKHSGIIDLKMYQYLKNSDFVIADISTLNPNALYELGIRHGIKPYSTILMMESKGIKDLPFDLNHISTFSYEHNGETIDDHEVDLKTDELNQLIIEVREKQEIDSPYFTFMGKEETVSEYEKTTSLPVLSYVSTPLSEKYVVLSLLGRWNDNNKNDKSVIQKLLATEHDESLQLVAYAKDKSTLLQLDGIHWKFTHKSELITTFNKYNTPHLLEEFKVSAVEVLSELDPKFELEKDKRFLASLSGKDCKYSKDLRFGISESLVWLSINSDSLLGEQNKYLVDNVVYKVLNNSDWHLWASLNELLPILAEASPKSFLKALQEQIAKHSEMITELFNQEGDGIISGNLMTGILWSLETIAWIPEYFQFVVIILAELSNLDIGGNYTNRPINSLKTLLLTWINNTTASIEDKMKAVKYLFENYPDITWKLLFSLLPSMGSTSFGCREPKYRTSLLVNFKRDVSQKDYIKQITEYSNYAIKLMKMDYNRIFKILDSLTSINPDSYEELFNYLSQLDLSIISENDRFKLWEQVTELAKKHRRFITAKWSYSSDIILRIEEFANRLKPTDKRLLYHSLFSLSDYELMDEAYDETKKMDWNEIRKQALEKRENAINELIEEFGLDFINDFITNNQMAISVAEILGNKKSKEIDNYLIPKYLNSKNEFLKLLCSSYIRGASYIREKNWYKHLEIKKFKESQIVQFLISLKFESETWELVTEILGDKNELYWKNVNQNVLACNSNFTIPVKMFSKVERMNEAIECIHSSIFNKKAVSSELIIETLISALSVEPSKQLETYKLIEILRYLENTVSDKEKLWQIEWAFYGLFVFDNKDVPKSLYKKLSTSPELYVELLKLGFKEDEDNTKKVLTEKEEFLAQNAWNLLNSFSLLPGLDDNNVLNATVLNKWINEVIKLAENVNRLSSAKRFIGHLLFHAPVDKDGFWIDKTVAKILNEFKNSDMLSGYQSEVINSRGCYTVDTTGQTENALGDKWKKRADELRSQNFPLFAGKADSIASFYYDEAKRSQEMGNPPEMEVI